MVPVILTTCVNLIALGVVLPVLPFYVTAFDAGPEIATLIFSVFSAASLLTAPIWGRLSDRIGRKPVMLFSVACTCGSYIWLAQADSLWEIFASRCFAGATAGWLTVSQAYIADVTTAENRAKGLGFLGAAFGVGFVIGPAISFGVLGGGESLALPAMVGAGFTTIGFVLTIIFIREPERREEANLSRFNLAVIREGSLARMFLVYFLVYLTFTGLEGTFALWTLDRFGFGPKEVSAYFVFIGIVVAIVQGGMIGPVVKRLGEAQAVFVGVILLALGMGTLPFAVTPYLVLIPLLLVVVGFSIIGPAIQSLMIQVAPQDVKGGVMGLAQSTASAARIGGPAWAGFVFAAVGADWPYYIAGLALLPVALMVVPLIRRVPAAQ
jgi:DHA1 family tetracycline resistance protein-like MFS transporter